MSHTGDGKDDDYSPRPIKRKVVTPERLLQLLNQRLENYGHCHTCHFVGPIRALASEADDGRNWNRSVAFVCSEGMGSGCKRIAQRILDDAAAEYNLRTTI